MLYVVANFRFMGRDIYAVVHYPDIPPASCPVVPKPKVVYTLEPNCVHTHIVRR